MLKVQNLTKEFNDVVAVDNVSFEVEPGKIFGLLGPNGAGKTTTIRIILDIIKPTRGSVFINGKKTDRTFQEKVGYLPEERGLYKKSKVIDVLRYFAELKGMPKSSAIEEARRWLKRLDIEAYCCRKIEELSKGNQQKIQFITAVVHDPELLILDEPFSGFDPINQQLIIEVLDELIDDGKLILLSTHQLEIAEKLCSNIYLINKGKEVLSGPLSEIKKNFGTDIYRIEFEGDSAQIASVASVEVISSGTGFAEIKLRDNLAPHDFLRCIAGKLNISYFSVVEPSLNKIFLESIKQPA